MTTSVLDPAEIQSWDEEVDVLVVGLGAAGAAAALEASRAKGLVNALLRRVGAVTSRLLRLFYLCVRSDF